MTLRALLLCGLLVASLPLRAEPSDDEKSALKKATQAYKDGAFDLANNRIAALLKKFPKTELLPQSQLLQAQADYQLGRSDLALAALGLPIAQVPADLQSDYLYWQAESLLDLARWPDAEQKYRALLALQNNQPERTDAANLGLAWALFKEGKQTDAMPLIQALIQRGADTDAGQQARLLLAKIDIAQNKSADAIDGLTSLLATNPEKGLAFKTDYWLGEAHFANGEYEQAVASYKKITGDLPVDATNGPSVQAFPKSLVTQAFLGLGRAEDALQQEDQAMLAYEQAYRLIEEPTAQMDAFHAYLESARTARQLPEAVASLQEFAKTAGDTAPAALLAIGTVLAEDKQDDKAIGTLESLLVAYAKSPWIPTVNYQLGLLYARTGKPAQAVKALQSSIATATDPALIRSARSELGEVLLNQTHDAAGAATQFALVAPGTDATAENASYNFLLAQAYLNKPDAFLKAQADFVKRFPKSSCLKKIALAQGRLLAAADKTDDAKAAYQQAIAQPGGNADDQKALLDALAELQYQTNDLEGTVKTRQAIVAQFPDNSLAAAQGVILVSYEMKKLTDDQAEQALIALTQKYDKTPDAPEAYFRLGEFYFYRQDYVKAQDAFQQLTTAYPNGAYSDNAYFFAGRAAAAHNDFTAALALLEKVPDNSPFKADARLWEGRVYQQQLNFIQATTLADQVLATEKTGPPFVEANLLKGQCLFAMATKNAGDYPQALAAFDQILKNKDGNIAQRDEAGVSGAKCLEKMGKPDEALGRYLDVLYGRTGGGDTIPAAPTASAAPATPSTPPAPSEIFWQIKAAWEAGKLREDQKDWRGAIEIYRRAEQIGGPQQQGFHELITKLRRDNYIYQ